MTKPPKKQFLARLDPELIRRVKVEAAEREISASGILEEALGDYFARMDKRAMVRQRAEA